jgi:hypothetical protein
MIGVPSVSVFSAYPHGSSHPTDITVAPGDSCDESADVFAWGVSMCLVVLQALGQVPHPQQQFAADREGLVRSALQLLRQYSIVISDIVQQCCTVKPAIARPRAATVLWAMQSLPSPLVRRHQSALSILCMHPHMCCLCMCVFLRVRVSACEFQCQWCMIVCLAGGVVCLAGECCGRLSERWLPRR